MPNVVVQPAIEKLLPPKADPAPKKSAPKSSDSSFDEALKNAKPKKAESTDKNKPVHKKQAAKPSATKKADSKAKPQAEEPEKPETDETDAAISDEQVTDKAKAQLPNVEDPKDVPAPKTPKDASAAKSEDAVKQPVIDADVSQVVQPIDPDAQKQQKPQDDQPEQQDEAQKTVVKQQPQVVQAKPTDDDPAPKKTAAPAKEAQQVTKASTQTKNAAKVAEVDENADATEDADADASDSPDVDAHATDDSQTVAKSVKKSATPAPDQTQIDQADKPAPVELGASLKSEQPATSASSTTASAKDADTDAPQRVADVTDHPDASATDAAPAPTAHSISDQTMAFDLQTKSVPAPAAPQPHVAAPASPAPQPPVPPEARFAEANHPSIVTGMRGQLLPDGGTMHIRLDPPELGALQVSVHMQDGVMTATFQTSNDDATRMLSHTLGQLKHVLESQGVSVDKLHVTQTPRDADARNDETGQQKQGASDNPQARQEQQRREILQRMWRRLANGSDPVDMLV